MSPQSVGIFGFLIMVALIFLRMPVAIALGLVGTRRLRGSQRLDASPVGAQPCAAHICLGLRFVGGAAIRTDGIDRRAFRYGA